MSYIKPEVLIHQYSPTSRSGGSPPIYESAATPFPIADFSGSPRAGDAPLTVAFLDLSTYEPTSWAWDFQDNGSVDSTYRYPTVTYNTAGTYNVSLTVSNQYGSSTIIKAGYIVVTEPAPPPPAVLDINFNTLGPGGASSMTASSNIYLAGALWSSVGVTFTQGYVRGNDSGLSHEGDGYLRYTSGFAPITPLVIQISNGLLNFTKVSFQFAPSDGGTIFVRFRDGSNHSFPFSGAGYFTAPYELFDLGPSLVSGKFIDRVEISFQPESLIRIDDLHFYS